MQPLKRIDKDAPIGTRVIVVTDDGLFTGKTTGALIGANDVIVVEVNGECRWAVRVYVLPEVANG